MFRKVLVANRGEIAVRVIRALHDLGVEAVAIYSEADRAALHVRLADEAYCVGPAPAAQSYLNTPAILEAARRSGAEAIHPGYGFLSESAAFAQACIEAGLVFVGPAPATLALMGDKVAARRLAAQVGVPTVPGTFEPVSEEQEALAAAEQIGFPLVIKAAAGGGGKGMRTVRARDELLPLLEQARREAQASFGDGRIYLERLVEHPRHIEVQLFGDGRGRVVHLGERECSIQRRYQKIVEEAPAPNLPDGVRHRLWDAAVTAATAAGYASAGTIEFLYEPSTGRFYFLEMNARLQVEHPVTELVSGVDLVQAQLLLAAGATLEEALGGAFQPPSDERGRTSRPLTGQEPPSLPAMEARTGQEPSPPAMEARPGAGSGDSRLHAVEARICAEDPQESWFPATGRIELLREPSGPGIRIDSACEPGLVVDVYYDPLLAKLIAWGRSREEAVARLRRALDEYVLTGVRTNLPFHRWLVRDPAFLAGELSTAFVAERWHPRPAEAAGDAARAAALAAAELQEQWRRAAALQPAAHAGDGSLWRRAGRLAALH